MKKFYLTLAAAALTLGLSAQVPKLAKATHRVDAANINAKKLSPAGTAKSTAAVENFYVDYSIANFDDLFYVWSFNSGYVTADTATVNGDNINPINYAAVSFINPLAGYVSDPTAPQEWPYFGDDALTIDSVFALVTHENNSGTADSIIFQIVSLDAQSKPTSTVLWQGVDVSDTTMSPGGNWVGENASVLISHAPAYVASGKVGLNLRYVASKLDTFSILAGSIDDGNGGTMDQASYQSSWTRIPPFIPSITKNANIGYGNPVGTDGWFEAQNWEFWAYVTYDVTSVSENSFIKGVKIGQSFPNPANKATRFFYELQKPTNVTINVHDMSGRLVQEYKNGVKEAGKHNQVLDLESLTSGVYFYTIVTDQTTITKRFVITK